MDMITTISPAHALELEEVIEKLKANGYTEIVECLLDHENDCYTKKGRLNKSATTRKMGWKSKQLEDALQGMRELLKGEFNFDDEVQEEDPEQEAS